MRYRLLGAIEVHFRDHPIPIDRPRCRAVLGYLLLHADQTISSDRLGEALWAGAAPTSARAQVQADVSAIRRAIREAGAPGVLATRPGGYELQTVAGESDYAEFTTLTEQARHRDDLEERVRLLRAALELWHGTALTGATAAFVEGARAGLEEQRLAAYEGLAEAELALGHHADVVADLSRVVINAPLRERLHGQLMLALHRCGRRADALAVARCLRRRLVDQQGLDPDPAIVRLEQRILRTDGSLAPPTVPSTVATRSRPPSHRPDEPSARPPSDGLAAVARWSVPSQLPPDIPDFTGRDAEADLLRTLLVPTTLPEGAMRVVAISGMGGVGKTALAVHAAHDARSSYPDGLLYLNLRGADASALDPSDVLGRFLRATGLDSQAVPDDTLERSELLRSRLDGRRVLLLLDNAASEEQIRLLLPGTPGCTVVITSRTRLTGVEGARWIGLDVLSPEQAVDLLAKIVESGRVTTQADDAAAIVRLCGWLPLAVRVAGARLAARPHWSLEHLFRVLADERHRLDGLATGDLGVRASIALSYRGLDDAAARLFRLLGTLDVPDFAGWVACAILETPLGDGITHLEALVDAQLLSVGAGIGAGDAGGHYRYRFHDLVRLFARERAEAEETAENRTAAVSRGLGAWLGIAEPMSERTPGPCYAPIHSSAARMRIRPVDVASVDPLAWFDAERAALMRAVDQACALGLDDLAYDLAGCLERYFDIRGMYAEWSDINTQVLKLCETTGNLRGQAAMLRGLIEVRTWANPGQDGDAMAAMRVDATHLLDLFAAVDEDRGVADALVLCSWAFTAKGDYLQARGAANRSLHLANATGHLGGQARALVALALADADSGQLETAIATLDAALGASRDLGNPRHEATVLQFLGLAHCQIGNLGESQRLLDAAMAISRAWGDRYAEVLTMLALARLDLLRGDRSAHAAAESALSLGRHYNMRHHIADALAILGEIDIAEGRPADAVPYLVESVAMWRRRGWLSFLASALTTLGLASATSDPDASRAATAEAGKIYALLRDQRSG